MTDQAGEPGAARPNLRIAEVVMDCNRPDIALTFWKHALGYEAGWTSGQFAQLHDPTERGLPILLQQVPEGKIVKNRVHVDLTSSDRPGEVQRLTALGARVLREMDEGGARWTVMIDPEGNEFCVVAGSPTDT